MSCARPISPSRRRPRLYEITVPPVHFVETASRHDVRPRQIEQALIATVERIGWKLPQCDLSLIRGRHLAVKPSFHLTHVRLAGDVDRPAAIRQRMRFGIHSRRSKIAIGTRQGMPGLLDVDKDCGPFLPPGDLRGGEDNRKGDSQHRRSTPRISGSSEFHGLASLP